MKIREMIAMALLILFASVVLIGAAMAKAVNSGEADCPEVYYQNAKEQIRGEAMVQGGLLCR